MSAGAIHSRVKQINETLEELSKFSLQSLVREELQGLSFVDIRDRLDQTTKLIEWVQLVRLEEVPLTRLETLSSSLGAILGQFRQISAFQPVGLGNAANLRNETAQAMEQRYNEIYSIVSVLVAMQQATSFAQEIKGRAAELDRLRASFEREAKELVAANLEAKGLKTSLDGMIKRAAILSYVGDFGGTAKRHRNWGFAWLWVIVISFGVALGLAYDYWRASPVDILLKHRELQSQPELLKLALLQAAAAKIVLFSVLLSFIYWAGSVYRSHRHNHVTNLFRSNVLMTYDKLRPTAQNDKEREYLLEHAAEAMFALQGTGYRADRGQPASLVSIASPKAE